MRLSARETKRAYRRLQQLRTFRHGAAQLVAAVQAFQYSRLSGAAERETARSCCSDCEEWAGVFRSRQMACQRCTLQDKCPHCWLGTAQLVCDAACLPASVPAGEGWVQLMAKLMISSEQVAATVLSRGPSAALTGVLSRMSSISGSGALNFSIAFQ